MRILDNIPRRPRAIRSAVPPLLVLLVVVMVPGCYWLRYYDLMETHVEVMESMANNAARVIATGSRNLTPADIERLRYPLERAQQFAEISRKHYGERESLAAFAGFVSAYEELHRYLDRIRARRARADHRQTVAALLASVDSAARHTRDVIDRERR